MIATRRMLVTLVLVGAVGAAGTARTEIKTWVGGDGQWEDAAKWNPPGEPGPTSDVRINAGAEEVCVGLLDPYSPGDYQQANTLTAVSTPDGEVCLEPWTGDWVYMQVHNGVLNQGVLCLEDFELETTAITNQGFLDLDTMEVIADIENHGAMLTWEVEIEGDVTSHADSFWEVSGYTDVERRDDGSGGNLSNYGEVWLAGHGAMEIDGTLHNHPTGHLVGGSGAVRVRGDLLNDGLLYSWGMDLGIHCPDGTFSNTGDMYNVSGSTLSVIAHTVNQEGVITVYPDGAVNFASDVVNQADGTVRLLGGTLSAHDITHKAGATLEGFGHIAAHNEFGEFRTVTNQGHMEFYADIRVVGHLDNQPGATIEGRNGDLTVVGDLTNNGQITWENGGVYCEGTYTGAGILTFAGDQIKAANGTMILGAGSTLNVTGTGRTDLYADIQCRGAVTVASGASAVFRGDLAGAMESLTIAGGAAPTGTIDLTENNLVVEYGGGANPFADVAAWLAAGFGGGPAGYWDGPGIQSSAAAAHPQRLAALGVIDNSDPDPKVGGLADLEGEPVSLESVLVRYTWWGDANLDGIVDSNDYDMIDTNWILWTQEGRVPTGGFRWAVGDFNYDGVIDSNDYDKIDNAWLLSGGAPLGGGTPAATPEPATLVLLAVGAAALAGRRTRR